MSTTAPAWWTVGPFDSGDSPLERRLRGDAGRILHAALEAVDPMMLVAGAIADNPEDLAGTRSVRVIAVGKAAPGMARAAVDTLGTRIAAGLIVVPADQAFDPPTGFDLVPAGHPVPTEASVLAGRAALRFARGTAPDEKLLCLISGGGSALLTLPPDDLPLDDVRRTTEQLLAAGASIDQINTVRKHVDQLKGGRLARETRGETLALVLSDVIDDPPDVIASGPVSPDPSTFADALDVLASLRLIDRTPERVVAHLRAGAAGRAAESVKPGDACFRRVRYRVVGSARDAIAAAGREASRLGYGVVPPNPMLAGSARDAGTFLARVAEHVWLAADPLEASAGSAAPPATCLVSAGETTVAVTGTGRGGRNQELALAAAMGVEGRDGILVASLGTDGVDGPTDAAGAVATWTTMARATALGLDAHATLARNDAYPFFAALHDLIITGPTGTNVMDLQLVLVRTRP